MSVEVYPTSNQEDLVEYFYHKLIFMKNMMDDIELGRRSVSGPPHKKAPRLKALIDGAEKSINALVKSIEDNDYNNQLEDGFSKKELKSGSSKTLFDIKDQLLEIRGDLEAGNLLPMANFMKKVILANGKSIKEDIIEDYIEKVAAALNMNSYDSEITNTKDGCKAIVTDADNGRAICFYVDKSLLVSSLRLVGKSASLISYMSQSYVQAILIPVLRTVGHIYFPTHNKILIPLSADISNSQSIACFDSEDGSPHACNINYTGFGGPKRKSAKLNFEKVNDIPFSLKIESALNERYKELVSCDMVKCKLDGKYKGLAGKVDKEHIVVRHDHIEVPVMFEYDNGFKDRVVLTDDDLVLFV